ncbi:tetratricopeptide repeat protein [Amycolatopsis alba]|uniref:tetratricopeptide repeat protein n=1 Tax=Amycolatopsis alba TaxID=76020 RepID=UPI00039E2CB9|nr:tetratricopeptide repeat protein [Amycolatopsis alba]
MLIVLDNARDTAQVLPLLPGDPNCAVLISSRSQLSDLMVSHGARFVSLDVLGEDDARQVLAGHLGGERLAAEPEAVRELLTRCAGLPLALSIVSARALAHPEFPLSVPAEELRDEASRLDALDSGGSAAGLGTVLSWSLQALSEEGARAFGLLGLAPGPDISTPAAASLLGVPVTRARVVLRELEHASLLQQHLPGRHRMHDLIRLLAADHARRRYDDTDIQAALRRAIDFALHTAYAGERVLAPNRPPIHLDAPAPGYCPVPLPDYTTALAWFESEHANLLAAQHAAAAHGRYESAWQLAWVLTTFHYRRAHLHDQLAAWQIGLAAVDHLADPGASILAHRHVGHACSDVGRHAEAISHLGQALILAEQSHDPVTQARIHHTLGWAWEQHGDDRRAFEHATLALRLVQHRGEPATEADALNAVGWYAARIGDYDHGQTHCLAALELHRGGDERDGEATTLDSLGYIATHTGRYAEAVEYYRQALALHRQLNNTYQVVNTLERVGHTYQALGEPEQARSVWQEALTLCRRQHRTADASRIQRHLTNLDSPL